MRLVRPYEIGAAGKVDELHLVARDAFVRDDDRLDRAVGAEMHVVDADHARVAAQRDSVVYRTPVGPVMERLVRVLQKLNPDKSVSLALPGGDLIFAGERQDLEEMLGNLMENAAKWSKGTIALTLRGVRPAPGDVDFLEISIEDDGPGIPEEKAREALRRGHRLDDTKPGTGLGLAIVADLVNEYGGHLSLQRSPLGGLNASVRLPSVA